uniref:Uncharacterized protein n=1 Tax=Mycena chlorophos TaxID=658473 RepID=A0ABQ0LB11_MYCCL|nr:predicted protein [Mycena chlorophos]
MHRCPCAGKNRGEAAPDDAEECPAAVDVGAVVDNLLLEKSRAIAAGDYTTGDGGTVTVAEEAEDEQEEEHEGKRQGARRSPQRYCRVLTRVREAAVRCSASLATECGAAPEYEVCTRCKAGVATTAPIRFAAFASAAVGHDQASIHDVRLASGALAAWSPLDQHWNPPILFTHRRPIHISSHALATDTVYAICGHAAKVHIHMHTAHRHPTARPASGLSSPPVHRLARNTYPLSLHQRRVRGGNQTPSRSRTSFELPYTHITLTPAIFVSTAFHHPWVYRSNTLTPQISPMDASLRREPALDWPSLSYGRTFAVLSCMTLGATVVGLLLGPRVQSAHFWTPRSLLRPRVCADSLSGPFKLHSIPGTDGGRAFDEKCRAIWARSLVSRFPECVHIPGSVTLDATYHTPRPNARRPDLVAIPTSSALCAAPSCLLPEQATSSASRPARHPTPRDDSYEIHRVTSRITPAIFVSTSLNDLWVYGPGTRTPFVSPMDASVRRKASLNLLSFSYPCRPRFYPVWRL